MIQTFPFDPFTLHAHGAVKASLPDRKARPAPKRDAKCRTIQGNDAVTTHGRQVQNPPGGRIAIDMGKGIAFGWAHPKTVERQRVGLFARIKRGLGIGTLTG